MAIRSAWRSSEAEACLDLVIESTIGGARHCRIAVTLEFLAFQARTDPGRQLLAWERSTDAYASMANSTMSVRGALFCAGLWKLPVLRDSTAANLNKGSDPIFRKRLHVSNAIFGLACSPRL